MIFEFKNNQQKRLRTFVLGIHNDEFGLGFKEDEQPDLIDTTDYYKGGGFWVAIFNHEIVGCIGLQKLDDKNAGLRKMFVQKKLRGSEFGIAQKLFDRLTKEASRLRFENIYLDTPSVALASHRFYQRNGFIELDKSEIPEGYTYPDRNSKIFKLELI